MRYAAEVKITRSQALGALSAAALYGKDIPADHFATGVKVGELTPTGVVIWTRRTKSSKRNDAGIVRKGGGKEAKFLEPGTDIATLEGASMGGNGYARLMVEAVSGREKKRNLSWVDLDPAADFAHQFRLTDLTPATHYKFAVETSASKGKSADGLLTGSFRTAPRESDRVAIQFALSSCQKYSQQDRQDGFWIYDALEKFKPAFLVSCGDNVYYDSDDPVATTEAVARYHWDRMFSLPTLHNCLRTVPAYFQKDDHDLLSDDCFPGMKAPKQPDLSFLEGQKIFRQQIPAPVDAQPMYRRFRWGSDLEIWLPDSRDHRSANNAPDGPEKTIWGEAQKQWLKQTLAQSTARWKLIVNPNPMVGPDHGRKKDNHANPTFASESKEMRTWLRDHVGGQVILMNGDRHWQYHSVDPETGLHEFGCGPASDSHAVSPSGGEDKRYHKFLRIKGGYVTARVDPNDKEAPLVLEHRDVQGRVVYRSVHGKRA
jgi:alkaline phosphatase D